MRRLAWSLVATAIVSLLAGVFLLDYRQAQRGTRSLLGLPWPAAVARSVSPRRAPHGPAEASGAPSPAGRIAVIMDELGARADVFERVLALGRPITVGVLPDLPLSRRIAREAPRAGLEVALSLPLEPYQFPEVDPGPGVLLIAMPTEELMRRTRQLLLGVPGVVGVVSRMGSRFSEDRERMRAVLEVVRLQNLYFVDSVTTPHSAGYDVARTLGMRAARRQVFLDPDDRETTGRARLLEAERWAAERGTVIAIGHGRLLTVRLLEEALPRWEARGLRVVPVSALLDGS